MPIGGGGEAALRLHPRALHEQHHAVGIDERLDTGLQRLIQFHRILLGPRFGGAGRQRRPVSIAQCRLDDRPPRHKASRLRHGGAPAAVQGALRRGLDSQRARALNPVPPCARAAARTRSAAR